MKHCTLCLKEDLETCERDGCIRKYLPIESCCNSAAKLTSLRAELAAKDAECEGLRKDAERLDALQRLVDESHDGMLLLHNGNGVGKGILGLGLRNTNRTLREAIDDTAMKESSNG